MNFFLGRRTLTGRGFELFETEDPKVLMVTTMAWCDFMKLESVLVMEAEEAM